MKKITKITLLINTAVFIIDRSIKHLALQGLIPFSTNHKLFSFDLGQNLTIISGSAVIAASIIFLVKRDKENKPLLTSLSAIILGGASNLYDRITLGFVIDYLPFFSFFEFNLADVLITFGCFLLAIIIINERKKIKAENH